MKIDRYIFPKRHIYFMLVEEFELLKIGVAINVKRRIQEIQTYIPYKVKLVLDVEERQNLTEKGIHKKLKSSHKRREWFYYNENLIKFIEELRIAKEIESHSALNRRDINSSRKYNCQKYNQCLELTGQKEELFNCLNCIETKYAFYPAS